MYNTSQYIFAQPRDTKKITNSFSGDYNALINKPPLFSGSYNDLTDQLNVQNAFVAIGPGVKVSRLELPTQTGANGPGLIHFADTGSEINGSISFLSDGGSESFNFLFEFMTKARIDQTGSYINLSDKSYKNHIEYLNPEESLKAIKSLQPAKYTFKGDAKNAVEIGLYAQEVIGVCPEAVRFLDSEKERLGLNYNSLVPHLIGAIRALSVEVDDLSKQLKNERYKNDPEYRAQRNERSQIYNAKKERNGRLC